MFGKKLKLFALVALTSLRFGASAIVSQEFMPVDAAQQETTLTARSTITGIGVNTMLINTENNRFNTVNHDIKKDYSNFEFTFDYRNIGFYYP